MPRSDRAAGGQRLLELQLALDRSEPGWRYADLMAKRDAAIPPERLRDLPTAPDNFKTATEISTEFWLENIDRLNERFNKWAAQ